MAHGKKYLPILSEGKCQKPYHLAPDVIYLSMMIFLYIKVQKISPNFGKKDFYILKKFNISVLKELRDWANENLSRVPPTQEN